MASRRKPKISMDAPPIPPARLTAEDVRRAHLAVREGLYRSEEEIWQREADLLNAALDAKPHNQIWSETSPKMESNK